MVRAALTGSLALTLTSACVGYEFVGPQAQDAAVFIGYRTSHIDSLVVDLEIAIEVGQDDTGRAHHPADAALMVNGVPVQPLSKPAVTRYEYEMHLGFSEPESATLTVILPAIGSSSVTDRTVELPVPRRGQPYELALDTIEFLALRLQPETAPLASARWRLDFATACVQPAELLGYVGAFDWPPDVIAVPGFVADELQVSDVAACLSINGQGLPDNSSRPFTLVVRLDGRVEWRISAKSQPDG